jgi:hypothetical protein
MSAEQIVRSPDESIGQKRLERAKAIAERLATFLDKLAVNRGVAARPATVCHIRPPLETKDEIWVSQAVHLDPQATAAYCDSVEDQVNAWPEGLEPEEREIFDEAVHFLINWA